MDFRDINTENLDAIYMITLAEDLLRNSGIYASKGRIFLLGTLLLMISDEKLAVNNFLPMEVLDTTCKEIYGSSLSMTSARKFFGKLADLGLVTVNKKVKEFFISPTEDLVKMGKDYFSTVDHDTDPYLDQEFLNHILTLDTSFGDKKIISDYQELCLLIESTIREGIISNWLLASDGVVNTVMIILDDLFSFVNKLMVIGNPWSLMFNLQLMHFCAVNGIGGLSFIKVISRLNSFIEKHVGDYESIKTTDKNIIFWIDLILSVVNILSALREPELALDFLNRMEDYFLLDEENMIKYLFEKYYLLLVNGESSCLKALDDYSSFINKLLRSSDNVNKYFTFLIVAIYNYFVIYQVFGFEKAFDKFNELLVQLLSYKESFDRFSPELITLFDNIVFGKFNFPISKRETVTPTKNIYDIIFNFYQEISSSQSVFVTNLGLILTVKRLSLGEIYFDDIIQMMGFSSIDDRIYQLIELVTKLLDTEFSHEQTIKELSMVLQIIGDRLADDHAIEPIASRKPLDNGYDLINNYGDYIRAVIFAVRVARVTKDEQLVSLLAQVLIILPDSSIKSSLISLLIQDVGDLIPIEKALLLIDYYFKLLSNRLDEIFDSQDDNYDDIDPKNLDGLKELLISITTLLGTVTGNHLNYLPVEKFISFIEAELETTEETKDIDLLEQLLPVLINIKEFLSAMTLSSLKKKTGHSRWLKV